MKNYDLDPVCYYTAPCLVWDASLKITDYEDSTYWAIQDHPNMLMMFENGIRKISLTLEQ